MLVASAEAAMLASVLPSRMAPMKRSQMKELDELVSYAADAVRTIIAEGVEKAMTKFNRRAPGLNNEDA
mgnify:CR=1 FL=1